MKKLLTASLLASGIFVAQAQAYSPEGFTPEAKKERVRPSEK